jgi:pyruvate kinase
MARIACETELSLHGKGFPDPWISDERTTPDIIADAAYHCARWAGVKALAVGTSSGASARLLSRYRPPVPIYAFCSSENVARQLSVAYGVIPMLMSNMTSTDQMLHEMERLLLEAGCVNPGDNVVFVAGQPVGLRGSTNMLTLHRVSGTRA